MQCAACHNDCPSGSAFCGGCGARLVLCCAQCGHAHAPNDVFCGRCGQRLAGAPAATPAAEPESGERRQLTVLFCDLVGSTDLAARLDAEEYRECLRAYYAANSAVIAHYGGYLAQHLGDGLLVYFGWPQAHDDAAERGLRAGLGMLEATRAISAGGRPLVARVGLDTGAVVVSEVSRGHGQTALALGDTPNVAARVQGAAQPHEVVITAATHRLVAGLFLVEPRGACQIKGMQQPVDLYRVVQPSSVRGRFEAAAARGFTPFINRTEERALLRSRFERVRDGEGQVVVLSGEAGIGKSRLAQVLREEIADWPHTWIETSCSAHFANTPFHAVSELLSQRSRWADSPEPDAGALAEALRTAGLDPADALPLLAPLLDVELPPDYQPLVAAPEMARKRLVAMLAAWLFGTAQRQPLVVLIEDLHWIDPSTLELLQVVVEQGTTVPLLLLATARPQFTAPWPSRAHVTHLTLSRLPRRHVRDMVRGVAAQATLLAEVIDEVVARTDGVPLFVEELTKAVVEVGAAAATHSIPSTLADSLMARLDHLGPAAKEVAQVAAVCGRQFSYAIVHALHPIADAELEAALQRLSDAELLHASGIAPQATYTFKHALVQDAAYESLLRSRRRVLHEQAAEFISTQCPEEAAEHPELLAHHYAAAAHAARAIAAWQQAAELASARGADREAEQYVLRGLTQLDEIADPAQRDWCEFQLQQQLGRARLFSHGPGAATTEAALTRALELGERLSEPLPLIAVLLSRLVSELTQGGPQAARALSAQLTAATRRVDSPALAAVARFIGGLLDFHRGNVTSAYAEFQTALDGFSGPMPFTLPVDFAIYIRTFLAEAAWMRGAADEARTIAQEVRALAAVAPRISDRAWALHRLAMLAVFLREPEAAVTDARAALALCASEPNPTVAAITMVIDGWCRAQQGDIEGGRATARDGIEMLVTSRQRLGLDVCHCLLSDIHARAGALETALQALEQGMTACPDQLVHRPETLLRRAELLWRSAAPAADIEATYREALASAERQGQAAFALRVATHFAAWLDACERREDAFRVLAVQVDAVHEGADTHDVVDARALLEHLRPARAGAPLAASA